MESSTKQTLADKIESSLERAIASGEYPPGSRLNELEISEKFSASRSPVREAIQRLAAKNKVRVEAGRGAFVTRTDITRVLQLFEALSEVEATCARLAARRITAKELSELEALHKEYSRVAKQGDTEEYYNVSVIFHERITQYAKNTFLEKFAADLSQQLRPYRLRTLELSHRIRQSVTEHDRVIQALKKGDEAEAEASMRAHTGFVAESAMDLLQLLSNSSA
ncbi:MAG: GntR family transcriptional regulator [Pseudomonadota bacterium]